MEDSNSRKVVEANRRGTISQKTYCVTGATGYVGSWLVKTLLESGCSVHATVRDPGFGLTFTGDSKDTTKPNNFAPNKQDYHATKCLHLLSMWTGSDRLRLFQADLNEEGSFNEAVKGCDGVFHVAASMEFGFDLVENTESYVQSHIIDPAISGILNLLKACLASKSVKRVVFTSSISTITAKDSNGECRPLVDESCQTPIDNVLEAKANGWVYALSKRHTEEAAFKFAIDNGIDLVSVITATVAGPFLTSKVPSSIQVLLSPVTGDPELFGILSAVNARMGSIALVHVEDICRAHIFLMEHDKAEGRYICCAQSCPLSKLLNYLAQEYPSSNVQRFLGEDLNQAPSETSSKKLRDLGFEYKHGVQHIIHQTITSCQGYGFLPPLGS